MEVMNVRIITLEEIKDILPDIDVIGAMKKGFIEYSNGDVVVPPVGEMIFENPPGEVHIKYGHSKKGKSYVIKIASGFYNNPQLGISSSQGLMLVFNQTTGQLQAVLLDEGHLTDIRTAGAGALAAKYFAPKQLSGIGIIGSGIQAKLQLEMLLKNHTPEAIYLWGRTLEHVETMKASISCDCPIHICSSTKELAEHANLIVTTTPSKTALLREQDIQKGSTIIAVGSDTSSKQELESSILENSDLIISDSIPQSKSRGEIFRAVQDASITHEQVIELGKAIQDDHLQRQHDNQTIVVDLTGVAVQDIMIANAVLDRLTP